MRLLTRLVRALGYCRLRSELDTPTSWTQRLAGGKQAFRKGDYTKAEKRFIAAFKGAEVSGSLNHRAAAALNNLGIVYRQQKNFVQAEIALRRALRAYAVMEPEGTRIASILCNLATVHQARRRYAEAARLYQQAIAMTEKILGSEHPKLAKRLVAYARLLEKMNDRVRAEKLRQRAREIRARQKHNKSLATL